MTIPDAPLTFLQALAHEVRWHIIAELAQSDRRVGELMETLGKPQNFVSYHLKQLRQAGLVRERRSIADARDVYYSLDLVAMREGFAAAGGHVHPALTPAWDAPSLDLRSPLRQPVQVLFVCTHNSARSQIAEALLRHETQGAIEAFSAGTHPTTLHPLAQATLTELGISSVGLFAKPLAQVADVPFTYRITVCDRAREEGECLPPAPHLIHWSLPDPLDTIPPDQVAFTQTANELTLRIRFFLSRIKQEWIQPIS